MMFFAYARAVAATKHQRPDSGVSATTTPRAAVSTCDALIEQAIRSIEAGGESSLRVEEVARQAGTPVTSIYHCFGGRAELIESAQRERFDRLWATSTSRDIAGLKDLIGHCQERERFTELCMAMVHGILDDARADERLIQLQLLGSAMFNDGARAAMSQMYCDGLVKSSRLFEAAAEQQLLQVSLDPLHTAAWAYLNQFSRVFSDLPAMAPYRHDVDPIRCDAVGWLMGLDFGSPLSWSSGSRAPAPERSASSEPDTEQLHPTAERLIDEVIEHLRERGELRLRLRAVARDQHVSESLIHRHFGTREELMVRAHGERFRRSRSAALSDLSTVVEHCASREEFIISLRVILRAEVSERGRATRLERLNVIGATGARPDLAEQLSEIFVAESGAVADGLEFAQDRGWISPAVDVLAVGMWLITLIDSQVCFELATPILDDLIWANAISTFLEVLLSDVSVN